MIGGEFFQNVDRQIANAVGLVRIEIGHNPRDFRRQFAAHLVVAIVGEKAVRVLRRRGIGGDVTPNGHVVVPAR